MEEQIVLSKEEKIYHLTIIVLVFFFTSVFYHYFMSMYLTEPYPYNTFLFLPSDRFSDFGRLVELSKDLNPFFSTNPIGQFPLVGIFGYLFSLIGMTNSFFIFLFLLIISLVFSCKYFLSTNNRPLTNLGIMVLTFLTYPFLFTVDRGNFEGLVFIFLSLFVFFFTRKRYTTSGIFLAFAIALKVFPAVLLLLFIPEKKYKACLISILTTIIISLISLAFFYGGFWNNLLFTISVPQLSALYGPKDFYSSNNFLYRSVSLLTLLKLVFIKTGIIYQHNMANFIPIYTKSVIVLFIPMAFYVVFIEEVLWKKVAILIISMVTFPQLSTDYRLIHLFFPLFLFVNSEEHSKLDWLYLILFALLLVPKNFYYIPDIISDGGVNDISISVPLNILIMIGIVVSIVMTGLVNLSKNKRRVKSEI